MKTKDGFQVLHTPAQFQAALNNGFMSGFMTETTSKYTELRDDILNDFATHFYLADAIKEFDKKDPVKALRNATILVRLLELKCAEDK